MSIRAINKEIEKLTNPFNLNKKEIKDKISNMIYIADNNLNTMELCLNNLKSEYNKKEEELVKLQKRYNYVVNTLGRLIEQKNEVIEDLAKELAYLKNS